jgi:hypothetical protein
LSNKDEAKREVLASELGQLRDKYSQLEQNFNQLKRQAFLNEHQGLVPAQGQLEDTFDQEANIELQ